MTNTKDLLTADHTELSDAYAARRYFAKFERITGHLDRVANQMAVEERLTGQDVKILNGYTTRLAATFRALSHKYLMTGRVKGVANRALDIDRHESGFPVLHELLQMANDAQQADKHLASLPSVTSLKDDMIRQIVGEQSLPTRLQFAMSQRLFYQALQDAQIFWAQNDPQLIWDEQSKDNERRNYTLHWAAYDGQLNVPVVYMLDVEDSARHPLAKDERRWPEVQHHLMSQSVGGLKLVTIARGFDRDFDDLHPKRLRRIHIGPMYSHAFTTQTGPIRDVLAQAKSAPGDDWALAWTIETLLSERVDEEKSGWFSTVEREIFALDPFSGKGVDSGATRIDRALVLPERPYQSLAALNPPGFSDVHKFVVGRGDRVLSYR